MATALERGDVPEETATFILGHERTVSMSYGLYSKGKTVSVYTELFTGSKQTLFGKCTGAGDAFSSSSIPDRSFL